MYLMVPKKQTCLSFGEVRRKKTKSNKFRVNAFKFSTTVAKSCHPTRP
ncbi:hypothetical protein PSM36_1578 [Proteiniphilum saccharofermentans]|uniref:Uncharacterized protein n=1 Tax=Proteiniphilum saccharofermentans TaxID=1642647 RepID=A0A1R3T541_9BACT|nr:hypothetical protein PSM36_1578 [Proteiniphilum saccharofermentans]